MNLMPLGDTAKDLDNLDFLGVHLQPSVAEGTTAMLLFILKVYALSCDVVGCLL